MVNKEMTLAAGGEMQKDKVHINQSSGNMSQEEISKGANSSIFKSTCIKLTGPAAESLGGAFFGPAVVVLQEIMGAGRGAEKGTAEAEDTANCAEKEKQLIVNRIVRGALTQIPPGRGGEGEGSQGTEEDGTTARVKPVSEPPARIVIAGTAGAGKTIKVLKQYRIVLLGKTGAGKSSLANTIFGEDVFKINHSSKRGASESQAESKSVHGRRITLVDTPGFFDTERNEEEIKRGILRCITKCTPGPHAVLIVLKVEKFTEQDKAVIRKICQSFSEEAFKYAAVVLTHGDQLPEGMKTEEFVDQNECLSDLVKRCGGRCHVVTSKYWNNKQADYSSNQSQVAELLNTIDKMVMENKGGCYTNKMLQAVERDTDGNRESAGNTPEGDTSSTPNNSVSKNMWIKLTGPAAESVAEAFFSPAVVVLQETADEREAAKKAEDEDKVEEDKERELPPEDEEKEDSPEVEDEQQQQQQQDEKEKVGTETKNEPQKTAPKGKEAGKSSSFWNFMSSVIGFFAGIGASVINAGLGALGAVVTAATLAVGTAVGTAVSALVGAVMGVVGGIIAGVVVVIAAVGAVIAAAIVWLRKKYYQLKDLCQNAKEHSGTILLVVVFFSLLLFSYGSYLWLLLLLFLLSVLFLLLYPFFDIMEASGTRRVILIGKTGVGKSSLANTILGMNEFNTDHSPNSETKACQTKTKSVNGRSITLTDTPGFFDTDSPEDELRREILRCIIECAPGPHAFLVVLKVEKFTKHEKEVIKQLCEHFSEKALKHAVIVFTLGEQLPKGMTIKEYVKQNEGLSDLVKKCSGRCHVVDNKYWNNQEDEYRSNQFQVAELLNTIDKLTEANNGGYYTNEVLDTVESAIQTEEECITESSVNMSREEIREKAKSNVFDKLLIKVTGTAVGTLLGALLGIAGMVAVVIVCLKEGFISPKSFTVSGLAIPALTSAAIGGAFGGYKGFQAAEKANTPKEAAGKALQDVWDTTRNVVSTIEEKVSYQIKKSGIKQ
ncbi:GTPase IMAP family member 8-like [Trachinotus anak]|uniref:GTPase IMAP family member 8-like n=1 Tax=Trachinotus anak TaxID=443729 RepID=UPI0039F1EBC1